MSLFTMILQFPREETQDNFARFIGESPNVMRSYRRDDVHIREWLERQELMKKGELKPDPPAIKFRFHFIDHVEALKRRERKRKRRD